MAASSSTSSATSSDNNEQPNQREDHAGLPSLESFLFLPQLPVDGDDGNEDAFLFRHQQYHVYPQRTKRSLSSFLAIIKPSSTKPRAPCSIVTSSISNSSNANIFFGSQSDVSHGKGGVSNYPTSTLTKHPLINTTRENSSNESNLVCGRVACEIGKSQFPFVATNDPVIATSALSYNHSNIISDTQQIDVVNNKSEEQRCSSSMSILINKNYNIDCKNVNKNQLGSPFSFAANHQEHHRNHPHLHQYHPHHHHHRRRWLIFRVCQVFSVILCTFFLFYLVKTSIWDNDEYRSRKDVYSYSRFAKPSSPSSASSFLSSRLQNRLIQSWNMPSMISPSSSPTTFKIPHILSDSISTTSNNNNTNDGDKHTLLLLDLPNFRFLMNNKTKCNVPRDADNYTSDDDDGSSNHHDGGANTIFFMIIIHSAPQNIAERQAIRSTWGSRERLGQFHIRLVFLLGHDELTDDNHYEHDNDTASKKNDEIFSGDDDDTSLSKNHSTFYRKLQRESQQHGDIVMGNFHDHYRALSVKHLMGYLWVLNHCSHAKFVLKADDDAFIDIFQLFQFILRIFGSEPEAALICNVFPEGTKPVRRSDVQGKKWAVTYEEYPYEVYPKYCGGLAYLATPNVIHEIYGMSKKVHNNFLWIDDVYVTGILRELAHIEPFYLNLRYAYDPEDYRKWLTVKQTREKNTANRHSAFSKLENEENDERMGEVGATTATTAEALSNQMRNERRSSPPQKIPFMIVHLERGSHLVREMRELWNKTVNVWSGSGLI